MEKINFALFFGHLAVYLFVWVFAITAHGAATAWMSNYFGDDTAKNAGRISFSPFVQADLIGTVIFPAIAFTVGWMSVGVPFIGWGKRVPVKSENWRNPKLAGVMVTLASTFVSLAIAFFALVFLKVALTTGITTDAEFLQVVLQKNSAANLSWFAPISIIFWYSLAINIVLAFFSLIPLPPFGGGVALFSLLPESFKPVREFFNKVGLVPALFLMYFVGIPYILMPILNFILNFLIR